MHLVAQVIFDLKQGQSSRIQEGRLGKVPKSKHQSFGVNLPHFEGLLHFLYQEAELLLDFTLGFSEGTGIGSVASCLVVSLNVLTEHRQGVLLQEVIPQRKGPASFELDAGVGPNLEPVLRLMTIDHILGQE